MQLAVVPSGQCACSYGDQKTLHNKLTQQHFVALIAVCVFNFCVLWTPDGDRDTPIRPRCPAWLSKLGGSPSLRYLCLRSSHHVLQHAKTRTGGRIQGQQRHQPHSRCLGENVQTLLGRALLYTVHLGTHNIKTMATRMPYEEI